MVIIIKLVGITLRQQKILERIIGEYIDSAKPVASQLIEKKYRFGISPATIRTEMQTLTREGYLFQPHTSAGRVPTDKGYRFFVDCLSEKEVSDFLDLFTIKERLRSEDREDIFKFVGQLTRSLAKASSNFVISCLLGKDLFFREGWEEVLKEPEFEDKAFRWSFTKFLDNFEKSIEDLKINSKIKIYIGKENPFKEAENFSLILGKCNFPETEEGIISILGPKRMAYEKNISLIHSIVKLLKEH